MRRIFAGQAPESYGYVTRSVRLNGVCTSIKLEARFWRILEEIARREGVALTAFLAALHGEAAHGRARNFASLLRCTCLVYLTEGREAGEPAAAAGAPQAGARKAPPFPRERPGGAPLIRSGA
jgi:predicted DNA-binding ribbon-helix-helix protein